MYEWQHLDSLLHRNEFDSGGTCPVRSAGKMWLFTFLALAVHLVVFVSAFVMVSTVWSVSCSLFSYSRCLPPPSQSTPCPNICKSGGRAPCSMELAPLTAPTSSHNVRTTYAITKSLSIFPDHLFLLQLKWGVRV